MGQGPPFDVIKAHAYGNDFLFVPEEQCHRHPIADLARAICHRWSGVGADGLILYRLTSAGASMRLWNADGSSAEVSGNGVRCLGAIVARHRASDPHTPRAAAGAPLELTIETGAGAKRLELLRADGDRYTFRTAMGQPSDVRSMELDLAGGRVQVVALSMGNPQCVVLGGPLASERLETLGRALQQHPEFPAGTNLELVDIQAPDRLRILIWERGVGATSSSGTGTCAAMVAAATFGGAARAVEVMAPGGSQCVEWNDEEVYLTGWAAVVLEGRWLGEPNESLSLES